MEENNDSSVEGQEGQGQEGGVPDPLKNLKAEFGRKFENITEQLARQNDEMRRALESLATKQAPAAPAEEVDPIVDPVRYKERVKAETKEEILSEIDHRNALSQATTAEVMKMQSLYPEFSQENSEAARVALQKFQALPKHLKGTPEGARLVLRDTADELGLTPVSRRKSGQDGDDYSVSSSGGGGSSRSRREREPKVDDKTLAFAELIGLNVNDPAVRKGIEERAKRDSWTKYR